VDKQWKDPVVFVGQNVIFRNMLKALLANPQIPHTASSGIGYEAPIMEVGIPLSNNRILHFITDEDELTILLEG